MLPVGSDELEKERKKDLDKRKWQRQKDLEHDCCIFRPALGCCTAPKAGQNRHS